MSEEKQDVIDDDEYNESVKLVMQDEATAGKNEMESISAIKLLQKRGHPKGATKTVIGLPKKRSKVGPVAFEDLLPEQKERIILSWFVGEGEAHKAIMGKIITEDLVEAIPENVNNACKHVARKFSWAVLLRKRWTF